MNEIVYNVLKVYVVLLSINILVMCNINIALLVNKMNCLPSYNSQQSLS